ncbi:SPOR domain-containing protein [Beijerinckia indica]|uniref:Sporulation domain protein n=1 Tax=Beijerinckia indica subsp. indica (strain ATCC 9039 / DSM 1715 / NCIMB 8712) TaxID=395963 RepID=B2IJG8_BEII9|nr:SPOR domain-containing protein [Beijerinckia indica]ACB96281.1 Sporulation domain protein [Beijerinckia indica subsp. indica ATCC 9039]
MSESVARRRPMIDLEEFERRLRQPSAQARKEDDALSALARLSDVAEDPFKAMFEPVQEHDQARGPMTERGWEAPQWQQPARTVADAEANVNLSRGRADFAAIQAGLLGSLPPGMEFPQGQGQAPGFASPHHQEATYAGHGYAATGTNEAFYQPYPDQQGNADLWPYDEVADSGAPEEAAYGTHAFEEPRSRRPLYIVAGILLVGLVGIGASFVYKGKGSGPHEVTTIMAESGPTKIQPSSPANADNVTQDASILDKSAPSTTAALTGHQEQPVDLSQAQIRDAQSAPLARPGAAAASVPVPAAPPMPHQQASAPPQPAPQQSMSIASLIEPKKVKTVSVRPDGTLLPNDTPPQTTASSVPVPAPRPAAPAAKAATPKSTARVTPKDPVAEAINGTASSASTPLGSANAGAKAKPAQQLASATPDTAAAAGNGAFSVQFAAPTSEQEARDIQTKLGRQYAAALGGRHTSIRKAVNGDKTVYRVRVGGLSREEATGLCQQVQGAGGNCFVAKN